MTLAAWPGQAVGQKLWLSVVSTPQITLQNWNPLNVTTLGAQSRGISKDLLKTLTDGSTFTLKLEASFDGGATRFPFSEQAYTIRSAPAVIPAPVIVEALAGTLNPITVVGGATFRASYPGMRATDTIVPVWNDISDTIPSKPGKPGGSPPETVESPVPATMIGAVIGKTIDVRYRVYRDSRTYFSDILKLTVEAIPPASLPTPQITEALGDVLDLNTFAGDANVTVAPWPFIAEGQTVWLRVKGSNGVPEVTLFDGYSLVKEDVKDGIGRPIARLELDKLQDGDTLTTTCKVGLSGQDGELSALPFPTQEYTISKVQMEETFHGVESQQVPEHGSVECETLILTANGRYGDGQGCRVVEDFGAIVSSYRYTPGSLTLVATLKSTYSSVTAYVEMYVLGSGVIFSQVRAYDEGGGIVYSKTLQEVVGLSGYELPIIATKIKRLEFTSDIQYGGSLTVKRLKYIKG
ncbi:hypothetical protein SLW74_17605, partial [Pseudomonas sp. W5-36]